MNDIIHLLPDSVANQIAAGEVIQRPASAVKEMLENAVDAGATQIQLIVKDAGRTLIQVVDNGSGMSFNDARMCFERHATSKLAKTEDLFAIKTKGFRGEALASIAAIAQVELKTKRAEDSTGTQLIVEGSDVKEHNLVATQDGTSLSVKNLFFNVPARRNFLKSDAIEFTHIEEEFNRVALIHTDISFTLFHNGKMIVQLQPSNFKQRIINLFGTHFKDKLFPVEQNTDFVNIGGFIAKPENAKKKKSEQYMFINNRYVRHPLLNYAIETAYSELIPTGYKPAYFIHLELDPATIDINISPTKVDVKLQDERLIFGFLNSSVKKSLGSLSLTPRLDFDYEKGLDISNFPEKKDVEAPKLNINPDYNPFTNPSPKKEPAHSYSKPKMNLPGWEDFLAGVKTEVIDIPSGINGDQNPIQFIEKEENTLLGQPLSYFIIGNRFLVVKIAEDQLSIIDVVNGRERILYESYLEALENKPIVIQQSLFPETIVLSPANADLLNELKDELVKLGYDIEAIDRSRFAVNGTPNEEENLDIQNIIENILESYKSTIFQHRTDKAQNIALSAAKQKRSFFKAFTCEEEVKEFLRQLFSCQIFDTTPSGKKIIHPIDNKEIEQFFI